MRAGMALTHAAAATHDDDSTLPRLATMVDTALQAGMPPSRIRSVIPNRQTSPHPGHRAVAVAIVNRPDHDSHSSRSGRLHRRPTTPRSPHRPTPTD